MKKNFKRTLAKVMAVALTVSMVGVASDDVDAAKKIKLSKKTISVAKGKTKKVTIKNVKAKKVKKLTVKSKNKKIATVKKAGKTAFKVTGKKAGKSTKVTVKVTVKGKKKATKLTLKVKVTKAKKVSPKTTKAPAASATPAASAAASATPAASAPASNAPASNAPASATPAPTSPVESAPATTTPDVTPEPEKTFDPTLADFNVALTEEKATTWSKEGSYGTVKFNEDGTVYFSSQPTAKEKDADGNETDKIKAVNMYNNGLSFILGADADTQTDVSGYEYVAVRLKADAEVKLMTWAGGDDANNFWDKSDTWGSVAQTVENADGSKTLVYKVATVFGKPAKAKAIGFTLKSEKVVGKDKEKDGNDIDVLGAEEATLYSITFTNKIPEAVKPAEPTATPVVETVDLDITKLTTAFESDVKVAAADKGITIPFVKNNQRVFFDIPENINLAQIKKVVVTANVPAQLTISLFNNKFEKTGNWWENSVWDNYPFWEGSKGDASSTADVAMNEANAWKLAGNGGYFSIAANGKPAAGFEDSVYKVMSVQLVIDHSVKAVDEIVEPTPATEAPEASKAPETSEAPEASKAPETSEAPEASKAPEASEAPEASKAPEVETKDPEVETKDPEVETKDPEVETKDPEVETKDPEVETKDPEATKAPETTKAPATEAPESP
ncbi:MAG TPA: hypothetical protein DEO89_04685, partial [Lachnospiraceae bacterium]|nr:hypothetical protein [Lachnospiraceae bacterium]